jgi:hypothetical protein
MDRGFSVDNLQTKSPSYRIHVVEQGCSAKRGMTSCEIGTNKNIDFNIDDLASYCFGDWDTIVFDSLLLAAAVEFCDRTCRRSAEIWSRKIALRIPVHDVARWNKKDVVQSLTATLNFLTGDVWTLAFDLRSKPAACPAQCPLPLNPGATHVIPFSDGLDSWSVASIIHGEFGVEPILVRLYSPRISSKPTDRRKPFALVPYSVKAAPNGQHLTTGRHRGFKFAMLGAVSALLAKVETVIVSESGQGALGSALVPVGHDYPDYRSHPLFTMRMERFVAALFERPIRYDFPRLWHTKGETLLAAVQQTSGKDAWKKTLTCWQGNRRAGVKGKLRQCGVCAACMLRRLSVHAADLREDVDTYIWDDLSVGNFSEGPPPTFSRTLGPFRNYAVAGASHMDHLAALSNAQTDQTGLRRHAFELAEWRGERPAEIELKLRRLLASHSTEWKNFVGSLGDRSFIRPWAMAAG